MVSQLELNLFFAINHAHHSVLDVFMMAVSSRWTWMPLYVLLLFLIWRKFKGRTLEIVIYIALLIALSDQGSVLVKNTVARLRPCHNLALKAIVNTPDGCGGKYGFISSHASNAMALSVFIILLFSKSNRKYTSFMLLYAFLIGYSRIYLGAHYPSDILGGYLLGTTIAAFIYYVAAKRLAYHSNS